MHELLGSLEFLRSKKASERRGWLRVYRPPVIFGSIEKRDFAVSKKPEVSSRIMQNAEAATSVLDLKSHCYKFGPMDKADVFALQF